MSRVLLVCGSVLALASGARAEDPAPDEAANTALEAGAVVETGPFGGGPKTPQERGGNKPVLNAIRGAVELGKEAANKQRLSGTPRPQPSPRPSPPPRSEPDETSGGSQDAAAGPADTPASVKTRQAEAYQKAQRMGEHLKKTFGADGDMPPGASGAASQPDGKADASRNGLDPLNPTSPAELVMASRIGFGGSFEALGLKVGPIPGGGNAVFRRDGSPATRQDLAELSAHIASEPAALMRRPDLYSVLPREQFQELKRDYKQSPGLRDTSFKDIWMSAKDRDFMHSASCSRLSGNCNPYTTRMSYRKGDFVPPEDLKSILVDIRSSMEDDSEDEEPMSSGKAASALDKSKVAGMYGRINAVTKAIYSMMGLGTSRPSSASSAAEAPAVRTFGGPSPGTARADVLTAPRTSGPHAAPPRPEGAERSSEKPRRSLFWLLMLLAAAFPLIAYYRRRKEVRP